MAQIIHADGHIEEIQPKNGRDFKLAEMKRIVGEGAPESRNYVQVVPTRDGRIMVTNEEGKLFGLPHNEEATRLITFPTVEQQRAMAATPGIIFAGDPNQEDYIVGTVLVCENHELR